MDHRLSYNYLENGLRQYQDKNWGDALNSFIKHMENEGGSVYIKMNIAKCHFNIGDNVKCIDLLNEIMTDAIIEKRYNVFYDLSCAHYCNKNYVMASEFIMKYCELIEYSDEESLGFATCLVYYSGILKNFWTFYENRKYFSNFISYFPQVPKWNGGNVRTLLVYGEQGFGDQIQFSRFIQYFNIIDIRIVIAVHKQLLRFFSVLYPGVDVVDIECVHTFTYDAKCSMLSIPYYLNLFDIKYLSPILISFGYSKSNSLEKFRVGLVWKGNPNHKNDIKRSISGVNLKELFDLNGVEFISLNPSVAQGVKNSNVRCLSQEIYAGDDFMRTAEVISTLDLVITVDTAPAHLAGTLGIPVWTLLPHAADWRWGAKGETTPWYPSMRLYRQETPGDWAGVMSRVVADLKALAST